jgi:predicted phosphodiesterase
MRYGVLSDVHGNLQALRATLAALDRLGVDGYLVAGDLVGYGPNPNECVELLAERNTVCVAGNHDLIALGRLTDDHCIRLARESLRWTRSVLTDDARAYLASLPLRAAAPGGVVMAHGALEDPTTYVDGPSLALAQLDRLRFEEPYAEVLIVGHTHRQWAFTQALGSRPTRSPLPMPANEPVLINPGAVGQSRDLRPRARFLLLDLERRRVTFFAARFELELCRAALRDAHLSARSVHLRPSPVRVAGRAARRISRARPHFMTEPWPRTPRRPDK